MNIDGSCHVIAEEVLKVEDIDESAARAELESAQRASGEGSEVARAEAQIRAEVIFYAVHLKINIYPKSYPKSLKKSVHLLNKVRMPVI